MPCTLDKSQPQDSLRERLFRFIWPLTLPIRAYINHVPLDRGKGVLSRLLLKPLLPPLPNEFDAVLPGNGTIRLRYREVLGFSTLVSGSFEAAETQFLCGFARPGTVAVDVGANVGVFTIPLAQAVGPAGRVLAFEPAPENYARLRANVLRNQLANVRVYEVALGSTQGKATLALAPDPAFHSLAERQEEDTFLEVAVAPLDAFWNPETDHAVSVLKIDVEGTELDVLHGAKRVVEAARPVVLAEARNEGKLEELVEFFRPLGYRHWQPPEFRPWNHAFVVSTINEEAGERVSRG
jgi:FkbM family methyltransferase